MSDPNAQAPLRQLALSDVILASARNVQAVLAGQSLSDSLASTPAPQRPAAQAVSFHTLRVLGCAREIRAILVPRKPPSPLLDALLFVSLGLLETALAHEASQSGSAPKHLPIYAPHTIVNEAVKAVAGHRKLQAFKALVNGVLRRYIRERADVLGRALTKPVSVYNYPDWWIQRMQSAYPEHWQAVLAAGSQPAPMFLRVNHRMSSMVEVLEAFKAADIEASALDEDCIQLAQAQPVQNLPGFESGWWSVQDWAAQQAGRLLPVEDGMRVLDACAAPGGKTAHLLERHDMRLTALDADAARLQRVEENLQRLRLLAPTVTLACADASNLDAWWDGKPFDAILADVPCTGSGVVRRHPDIRWLRRDTDIEQTAALQRRICDALWRTLRPGGHLLYVTCSVFPEECEAQARAFAQRHEDAQRLSSLGQLLPGIKGPHPDHDGFFYALFTKGGGGDREAATSAERAGPT